MRMQRCYHVWPAAIQADGCDRIVALGGSLAAMPGAVRRKDPTEDSRRSTVSWIPKAPEHAWLFQPVALLVDRANRQHWNWRVTDVESMQYTLYGPGQYYGWHTDQRPQPYPADDKRWPNLTRKLSVTIQLSSGDEYDGGDFEIEQVQTSPEQPERRIKTLVEARERGTVIVFPSFQYHRVTPVTRGVRRSLVAWFLGPPWA